MWKKLLERKRKDGWIESLCRKLSVRRRIKKCSVSSLFLYCSTVKKLIGIWRKRGTRGTLLKLDMWQDWQKRSNWSWSLRLPNVWRCCGQFWINTGCVVHMTTIPCVVDLQLDLWDAFIFLSKESIRPAYDLARLLKNLLLWSKTSAFDLKFKRHGWHKNNTAYYQKNITPRVVKVWWQHHAVCVTFP